MFWASGGKGHVLNKGNTCLICPISLQFCYAYINQQMMLLVLYVVAFSIFLLCNQDRLKLSATSSITSKKTGGLCLEFLAAVNKTSSNSLKQRDIYNQVLET